MTMLQRAVTAPETWLSRERPDEPVLFFSAGRLVETFEAFRTGFPGLVTFAVKANPAPEVLRTLTGAGMEAFDVASPAEIAAVRAIAPGAALHYNNPVRSRDEIGAAVAAGVRSFSVDRMGELEKLAALVPVRETEVSVRLKLPMRGAAYDFGTKFGASPEVAAELLARAAEMGFAVSMCFHPGTQCADPASWGTHIAASAACARRAGVRLQRLNVGGGMAADRDGGGVPLGAYFAEIRQAWEASFDEGARPGLVCEPGRAMVAEAMTLAVRVKARDGASIFLNDGRYGSMSEFFDIGPNARLRVPGRTGAPAAFEVFGPTCDSLDRLPAPMLLPADIEEGDHILIEGMGAYSNAIATRFNGYGAARIVPIG